MNTEQNNDVLENPEAPADRFSSWHGMDTENDEQGKVTLCAMIDESGTSRVWKDPAGFIKWCDEVTGSPVVICHNLEYDLVNVFGDAYQYLRLNYLKGRLISARYGKVSFLDSLNHFRMSLAQIGVSLGIHKLKMDIYSEEYVVQDALISLKVMTGARDFIAALGGQIGATSGSSAISIWRKMTDDEFCTGAIDTPWMRKGYYGGRTEVFHQRAEGNWIRNEQNQVSITWREDGQQEWSGLPDTVLMSKEKNKLLEIGRSDDIRGYDVNSMYPFCMLADFPESILEDNNMSKDKGMAEVTISIPHDMFVAPLCYRDSNGRLLYPVGIIRGVWTYDELRFAEDHGAQIIKVHKGYGCNTVVRPFDDFILGMYARRKATNIPSEKLFLKVLMNSLYGKIASKNTITRTVSRHTLLKGNSSRLNDVKWISPNRGLLDYKTPSQPYVNMVWGSMITANSRTCLTQHLMSVPPERLIYCDTDSIYCINHDMPVSDELGGLKLEKTAGIMEVWQPKAYRLDGEYKAKGVPKARNGKDFAKEYIEEGFTEFEAPIRFRRSINSRLGKANQWIMHSKGMKTTYSNKTLSNGRYLPPVIGQQQTMNLGV